MTPAYIPFGTWALILACKESYYRGFWGGVLVSLGVPLPYILMRSTFFGHHNLN